MTSAEVLLRLRAEGFTVTRAPDCDIRIEPPGAPAWLKGWLKETLTPPWTNRVLLLRALDLEEHPDSGRSVGTLPLMGHSEDPWWSRSMKKPPTLVVTRKPIALAACPRCHRRVRTTSGGLLWSHRTLPLGRSARERLLPWWLPEAGGRRMRPAPGVFAESRWARGLWDVATPRPAFPRIFPAATP